MATSTTTPGIKLHRGALAAGFATFIGLYILLNMLMIFALSMFSHMINHELLYGTLKIIGLLSWALPGYITARIARRNFVLHGLIIGVIEGICISAFLFFTFSWDAGYSSEVVSGMLLSGSAAIVLGTLGGLAARFYPR